MTNNYLRNSIISVLFAIPFICLIVMQSMFFPYITGKNLIFRFLVEIAAVLYILLALRDPAYRPKFTSIFVAFAAFLGILLVADTFGEYAFKSFWSNFERMEGFVTHLHLFVYFIIMTSVLNTERLWKRLFQTSLGASVIMGLFGLNQLSQGTVRIDGQLGNSTYLGAYMLFHIFIAGFLLARHISRPKNDAFAQWSIGFIYAAIIAFDFFILYSTGTRGALLGLMAGAGFTALSFAIWEKNKALKFSGIALLIAIVIAVGSLAAFKNSQFVQSHQLLARFSQLATFDPKGLEAFATTEGKGRFGIWNTALTGFKERPILGWGQDNFNYVFNKYYTPNLYDQEAWFDRAHNVFLDWLIAGGILGLLAYLALFGSAVVAIWRSKKENREHFLIFSDKVILTALLIAYFIHNLFVFDNISSYILFFAMLAFVNIHERKNNIWPAFYRPFAKSNWITVGTVAAIAVGVLSFYYFTAAPYMSSRSLIQALIHQAYGEKLNDDNRFKLALESYKDSLSYQTEGKDQAREQLLQNLGNVFNASISNETKAAYFEYVTSQMDQQIKETPEDARPFLFYGSMLTRLSASSTTSYFQQGIKYLERAHELSPNKQGILFELGSAYINTQQYKQALPYFKQAFELDESYSEARFYYAVNLIGLKDFKTAEQVMAPLAGTDFSVDIRLIKAYYDAGQIAKVNALLQGKVNLAQQYAKEGKKAEAIAQLQEVISINPAFKAQGEAMIAQIQNS